MIVEFPASTFQRIERHLKNANINYHIEDGEFYLTENYDFPCWLIVNDEDKYIHIKMKKKIKSRRLDDDKKILMLINSMNRSFYPNAYYYEEGHIYADCYQFLEITSIKDNITNLIDQCVCSFTQALDENDVYRLVAKEKKVSK
jgi:hypothetical protein